jgi:hypothetical protein
VSLDAARPYLYGVTADWGFRFEVDEAGLNGEPVRFLRHRRLSAVISSFSDERVRATRANLSAHERVVAALRQEGTILPVRFGVLMETDQDVVEQLLERKYHALSDLLKDMDGKSELRVQASYLPDVILREAVSVDPSIVRLRNRLQGKSPAATYYDRIRMGEMVAAAVEGVRAQDNSSLTRGLSDLAVKTQPLATRSEQIAMNAAFLCRDRDIGRFEDAVASLADTHQRRLKFRVVGPLAPWDFVDVDLAQSGTEASPPNPAELRGA